MNWQTIYMLLSVAVGLTGAWFWITSRNYKTDRIFFTLAMLGLGGFLDAGFMTKASRYLSFAPLAFGMAGLTFAIWIWKAEGLPGDRKANNTKTARGV